MKKQEFRALENERRLLSSVTILSQEMTRLRLSTDARYSKKSKRLLGYGFKAFSQCDEDGIIAEIFNRVGTVSRRFVEFGVGDGRVCNTILLLLQGWQGTWLEKSADHLTLAERKFRRYPITTVNCTVTTQNVDALIAANGPDLDLLSIDIDGNDYWVWKSVTTVRPRVVVIEYNAIFPPNVRKAIAQDPNFVWTADNYFGASLGALTALGIDKGYSLVGCSVSGVNAFFVRNDLVENKFAEPFTAENHYEPARYSLVEWTGYPPGMGDWVDV